MQTNYLCSIELFEIKLFDHLTMCKQMAVLLNGAQQNEAHLKSYQQSVIKIIYI